MCSPFFAKISLYIIETLVNRDSTNERRERKMMEIAVKILNYAGYLYGCNVLGNWFAKFYWSLFTGLTEDEEYATNHPKMFVAKVVGLMVVGILIALAIIWYPMTKLMKFIDGKIEKYFKEDEEDEDFLD